MAHWITAEISRAAVRHNLRVLRGCLPAACRLCAVVKADCYGHGLAGLLETIAAGADALAVATVAEAVEVRARGYAGDVLVLLALGAQAGGAHLSAVREALVRDVQVTLTDPADVAPLDRLAGRLERIAAVHVEIETGMGRSGCPPAEAAALVEAVRNAAHLRLAGVYTHFAASDEQDKTHAEAQFACFRQALAGIGPLDGAIRHAANSAAVADLPHTALDMVRPGIAVYGYQPSDDVRRRLDLRPCLRLTAPVVQIKRLPAGATCGYGCTCRLERNSRVGIVPAGYNDGVARGLSGHCPVAVAGRVVPVLGRVSMDQLIIDLTDLPAVKVGDACELISPDTTAPHSVANLARLAGTIPYEVTCRLGRRTEFRVVDDFGAQT